MAKRRRVFLLRHGDVSYFTDTGGFDPPLNDAGVEQAKTVARFLEGAPIDRVIATGRAWHSVSVAGRPLLGHDLIPLDVQDAMTLLQESHPRPPLRVRLRSDRATALRDPESTACWEGEIVASAEVDLASFLPPPGVEPHVEPADEG